MNILGKRFVVVYSLFIVLLIMTEQELLFYRFVKRAACVCVVCVCGCVCVVCFVSDNSRSNEKSRK